MTPLTRPLIVLRRSVQYSSHFHKLVIRLSISIAKDIHLFQIAIKWVAHSVSTPVLLCHKEPAQGT